MNYKKNIIYLLSLMIFCSTYIQAMEPSTETKYITVITNNAQEIKIPENIVPLIPFFQTFIKRLGTFKEKQLILGYDKALVEPVMRCIIEVKENLKTRNELLQDLKKPLLPEALGNQYIPQEINNIVKKNLKDSAVNEIMDMMEISHFLDVNFMINACASLWVTKLYTHYPEFKNNDIEKINEIIENNIINPDIQQLIKKHVLLQRPIRRNNETFTNELSIADTIALNQLDYVSCDYKSFLDGVLYAICDKQLTSLQGFKEIPTYYHMRNINRANLLIDFSNNDLLSIDIDPLIFQKFEGLTSINLSRNRFIDINAINIIFPYCTQVTSLSLAGNQLTKIGPSAFTLLSKLKELYLDNNQLKELDAADFQGLNQIKEIGLSNNQLTEISGKIFDNLSNIEIFDLSNNQFSYINPLYLKQLKKLKNLDISGNYLTEKNINDIKDMLPKTKVISSNQKPQTTGPEPKGLNLPFTVKLAQKTPKTWGNYFFDYYTTLKNKLNEYRKWIISVNAFSGIDTLYKYLTKKKK